MSSPTVILVHGLYMSGIELTVLRHRLNGDHGLNAICYSYRSVTGTMVDHVKGLRELAKMQLADELHFVGHSLGGVVVLDLLESTDDLPPGRAVLLGSPVQGSCAV